MTKFGPRIVSDAEIQELDAKKNAASTPHTIFLEVISPAKSVRVDIIGEWDNEMAEAVINFIARRRRRDYGNHHPPSGPEESVGSALNAEHHEDRT